MKQVEDLFNQLNETVFKDPRIQQYMAMYEQAFNELSPEEQKALEDRIRMLLCD